MTDVTQRRSGQVIMDKKLKPCPFCGGEAVLKDSFLSDDSFIVRCTKCYAQTDAFISNFDTPEEAIAAWNRRAKND